MLEEYSLRGRSSSRKNIIEVLKVFITNKSRELNGQTIYGIQFIIIGFGSIFFLQNSDKVVTLPLLNIILSPTNMAFIVAFIGVFMILDDILGQKIGSIFYKILNGSLKGHKKSPK